MGTKPSLLAFRAPNAPGVREMDTKRRPTQADRDYIRAMARRAAQDVHDHELAATSAQEHDACE